MNEIEKKELLNSIAAKQNEIQTAIDAKAANDDLVNLKNSVNELVEKAKGLDEVVSLKDAIAKMEDVMQKQGEEIAKSKSAQNIKKGLFEEVKEKKEDFKKLIKGQLSNELELKADTLRASITDDVQAFEVPEIGQLAHRKLTVYDLFPKITVGTNNNSGVVGYYDWDEATTVRAAAAIAEGAAFPESTAKWIRKTINLQKVGDSIPVSDEFMEDDAQFAAELGLFLQTNVAIKIDTDLVNANGTAPNLKGLMTSINAYTPAASGITDASIYDLIVKLRESIQAAGGSKYMTNFALMNLSDINKMKLKKDANNNYIIPPFVDRNGNQVDGVTVVECNAVTANTMAIGDNRYARIYEKAGYTVARGTINAQFTDDMETLKVRKRLALLVRDVDKGGFLKVTSISAALTTLAS